MNWTSYLAKDKIVDSYHFWAEVYTYQDAGGTFIFRQLSEFILKILVLPSSNAIVERTFSIMNSIKTKSRNRISIPMLEALLRIRCYFISSKHCCTMFTPTKDMYKRFNSQIMYPKPDELKSNNQSHTDNNPELDDDLINLFNEVCLPDFYD